MTLTVAAKRALASVAAGALVAGLGLVALTQQAGAHHEPANKFSASASSIDTVPRNGEHVLLSERIKVSSPFDLGISFTAECSILTALKTGGAYDDSASATGSIEVWVEVDGKRVPVSTADSDPATPGTQTDNGEVVLCNRTYQREVTDAENDEDGTDEESDYIQTRTANAFNWLALDTGFNYDSPANGNNILDIVVKARYNTAEVGTADAEAFVGARSLVVEPTNASNHEQVTPAG